MTANWGSGTQTTAITLSGTGQFLTPSLKIRLNHAASATNVANLNLDGGILQTLGFDATTNINENADLNFNGGTLEAGNATNASFMTGLGAAYIYSGGGTINNNSQAITIAQPLLAVSGTGVTGANVSAAGSGYTVPPEVTFTGGTAIAPATGYATINPTTGAVTGIVITNPGIYTTAPTGITLTGGGGSGASASVSTTLGNTGGTLTFSGGGTTTLTGVSTYNSPTAIAASSTLTIGGAGQLGSGNYSGNITNAGTFIYNSTAAQGISGNISGAGGLTQQAGTLLLSGTNSYGGTTTISGGTLQLSNGGVVGGSSLLLSAASGVTTSAGSVTGWSDLSGNGRNAVAGGGTVTYSATGLNGAPTLVFNGSSYLADTGASASNNTGTIIVLFKTNSTTAANGATFIGPSGGGAGVQFRMSNGGTLTLNAMGNTDIADSTSAVVTTNTQIDALTFNQASSGGAEQFYVNGSAVATSDKSTTHTFSTGLTTIIGNGSGLQNNEEFTGDISAIVEYNSVLSAAQIAQDTAALNTLFFGAGSFSSYSVLPTTTPVNISASGAALDLEGITQSIGSLTGVSGSHIYLGGGALITGSNTTAGASTTYAGSISDTGGVNSITGGTLTKIGAGTEVLTGSNSYSGGTFLNGGILNVNSDVALGLAPASPATSITFTGTSTLQFGASFTTNSNRNIVINSGVTGTLDSDNKTAVVSGVISGPGGLAVANSAGTAGSLTLSGDDTYTGATSVNSGVLSLTGTLGAGGGTAINNSATFTETGAGVITGVSALTNTSGTSSLAGINTYTGATNVNGGGLTLSGTIGSGAGGGTAITNASTFTETAAGVITGASSLTNTAGTATISGVNPYTGATAVNGGTLKLTGGSLVNTPSVSVAGGATLAATGSAGNTIAGLVTLAGGSSAGGRGNIDLTQDFSPTSVLNLTGGLTIGGASAGQTSNLSFDLASSGSASDLINLGSGALTGNLGGGVINIGTVSLNSAIYTLIDYGSVSGLTPGANLTVGTHPAQLFTSYTIILTSTTGPGSLELMVAGTPTPNLAYWTGLQGGSYHWGDNNGVSATNWATNAAGTTDAGQLVGLNTDVVFAANNATTASLNTYLEANYAINSLTIRGSATDATSSAPTVVGGTGTLTINALASGSNSLGYAAGTGIVLNSGADGLTINTTGGLVVANSQSWSNNSPAALSIASNVSTTLSSGTGTLTIGGAGAGANTVSGVISDGVAGGELALVVNGAGVTTLSGSNTYSGGTTLAAGGLDLANASALSTGAFTIVSGTIDNTSGSTMTLANNNAQNWNGSFTFAGSNNLNLGTGAVTLGASPAITVASGTLTESGNIGSSAYGLTLNGGGTLVLAGSNSYTGGDTINGGTLSISAANNLGISGSNAVSINGGTLMTTAAITDPDVITIGANGGGIDINSTGVAGSGQFYLPTANTLLGNGTLTVSGNGALTTTGAGNLRLGGSNAFSGNVIIQSGGIVEYGVANAIASSGTFTINNQGELAVNSGLTVANNIIVNGVANSVLSFENGAGGVYSGAITVNGTATIGLRDWYGYGYVTGGTISGQISGNGALVVNSGSTTGGTLTLTNTNSYTGPTTITTSTLQLGNGGTAGSLSPSSAITDNGTLVFDRSNAVVQGVDFSSGGITGSGGVTQSGLGPLTLSASNSFTGLMAFSASSLGTVILANPGALAGISDFNLAATTGNTLDIATNGGDAPFGVEANTGFSATILSDLATPGAGINHTLGAATLGGGTLNIKAGSDVTSGTASITLASLSLTAGSTQTTTLNPTTASLSIGPVTIGLNNQSKTLDLDGTIAGNSITGAITNGVGTVSLTKSNTSTWTLSAAGNTYSGPTTVSGGELDINNATITQTTTIAVGTLTTAGGAIYQSGTGSVVACTSGGGGSFQIGSAVGAAGYYNLAAGTINVAGEIDPGGLNGGAGTFAEFDINGGTVNLPNSTASYFFVNRSAAAGETAVVNVNGGTVRIANGGLPTDNSYNGLAINQSDSGAADAATITLSNGGQFLTPSLRVKLNEGGLYNAVAGNTANIDSLNLDSGGLLQTLGFQNGTSPNDYINFNGGTLRAGSAGNSAFLSNIGGVYVYSGGGTFDNNGKSVTIAQPILAVSGSGVSSVAVAGAGSGYVVPPEVSFTGGGGTDATGYATIDPVTGAVTGIVITNPGTGYTSAPSVTLTGTTGGAAASPGSVGLADDIGGAMTYSGAGITTLTGSSTYAGGSIINAGTVQINSSASLGATSGGATINNGATLEALDAIQTARDFFLSGNATIQADSTYEIDGLISDGGSAGTLVASGSGVLDLTSASNSYSGGTIINAGAVQINNDANLGASSGAVTINNGSTLEILAGNTTTGSRNFSLSGTATVQIDQGSSYSTSGNISDGSSPGSLVKTGSGTLGVGDVGLTGNLTVNKGALIVSGYVSGLAGPVTVNSGGTLGGGGSINGSVDIGQGGTIAPGFGASFSLGTTLTIYNNLTLSGTAGIALNMDTVGDSDLLSVNNLSIDPTDTLTLTILGTLTMATEYTIADYAGIETGSFALGNIIVNNGILQNISYGSGNNDSVTVTIDPEVVPEPGAWAMMMAGGGMLLLSRRLRRRHS